MSIILKRRGGQRPPGGNNVLTAPQFLGKEGGEAYLTPDQLLNFVDRERLEDVDELDAMFDMVKAQLQIRVPRRGRTDKGLRPYKYVTFLRPNSPDGVKVIMFGRIEQFLLDYRDGKFIINFSLEELVAEAEKA